MDDQLALKQSMSAHYKHPTEAKHPTGAKQPPMTTSSRSGSYICIVQFT